MDIFEFNEVGGSVKQVTRDHNTVTDGWAGAANPHLYPMPHPTPFHYRHIHEIMIKSF